MPANARPQADFAAEAAQLMLRLGLAIILIVVPTGAIYSRRLLFTLVPVGVALICSAPCSRPAVTACCRPIA